MRQSGVGDAVKTMAAENDAAAEAMRAGGGFFLWIEVAEREVEAVEVFPHLAGNAVTDGAGVFPSFGDTLHNRTGIVRTEGEEFEDVVGVGLAVELAEQGRFTGHGKNGIPS